MYHQKKKKKKETYQSLSITPMAKFIPDHMLKTVAPGWITVVDIGPHFTFQEHFKWSRKKRNIRTQKKVCRGIPVHTTVGPAHLN
jgi:hypothetical protein